jgi:hypothetical protein
MASTAMKINRADDVKTKAQNRMGEFGNKSMGLGVQDIVLRESFILAGALPNQILKEAF